MKLKFYAGGYNSPLTGNGQAEGDGIFYCEWNSETGESSKRGFPAVNPSFLLRHPVLPVLYSVSEVEKGLIQGFFIRENGEIFEISRAASLGSCPCHLALSPEGDILSACNYESGSASFYRLLPDGRIGELLQHLIFAGRGNHSGRQEGPHTHSALFSKDGFCYLCELGTDGIYRVRTEELRQGRAKPEQIFDFTRGNNCTGVRMGCFSADEKFYYAAGELDGRLHVFRRDQELTLLNSISAEETEGENYPAHPILSPDGKFLYLSVRGEDRIVRFVLQNGLPAEPKWISCGCFWPRILLFCENMLLCGGQKDGDVVFFRPGETGDLKEAGRMQLSSAAGLAPFYPENPDASIRK